MPQYQLATDGDSYEKHYYPLFIQREFPSYESFWQEFVTPLTRRPVDIHIKDDIELTRIGRTANDICIAQLHYSVLRHLIRAYELQRTQMIGVDHAFFGLSALCGAQDVAFELLERFRNPDFMILGPINGGETYSADERRRRRGKRPTIIPCRIFGVTGTI